VNINRPPKPTVKYSKGRNRKNDITKDMNTAIPPISATYLVFQRSSLGIDIHLNLIAATLTKWVSANARTNEVINGSKEPYNILFNIPLMLMYDIQPLNIKHFK
jgi:hypothetical protein